jgi:N-acetylglucosaminyldiphosphoundecaprenol N-acetyl-beta-D-mannosaminyltransferase
MDDSNLNSLPASRPPIAILGVPFDNVNCAEAITLIEGMIASRRPHYLVTANVDFLVQAGNDVELRRILLEAHMVLCDGTPLVWASRFLGNPLPERVAGADLAPRLIRLAAEKQYRVFFLGATPESAEEAARKMQLEHPTLVLAGHYSPPFDALLGMDHDEIKRRVRQARPDLLFVAFGCPKAEKWIAMHYQDLGVPVVAGIGATIDFLAGRVKRAPDWIQRAGGEWLFRLAQEPRRLARRYGKDLWVFGRRIVSQWLRLRAGGRTEPGSAAIQIERQTGGTDAAIIAKLQDRLDVGAAPDGRRWMTPILSLWQDCLLDLSAIRFIDSTGVALLVGMRKRIHSMERHLVLVAPSRCVQRALALMQLGDYFDTAPDAAAGQEIIDTRKREEAAHVSRGSLDAVPGVAWRGEITAASAGEVWDRTCNLLRAPKRGAPVVIDLSDARFIDSAGLRIMVQTQQLAWQRGTTLIFAGAQPAVRNVLRNAGLELLLLERPELLSLLGTPVPGH